MLNRIVLTGRLTADPEYSATASGVPLAKFRIAVDRPQSSESRNSGQAKETDFIDIVAWRQTAEFVANYLQKGRLVFVDGRLQIREFVKQDGQRGKATEVVADKVGPLDRARDGENGGDDMGYAGGNNGGGGGYEQRAPAQPSGGGARGGGGYERGGGNAGGGGGYDRGNSAPPPARGGNTGGGRPGGRAPQPANDYDDDMSDLSDPFAE